MSIKDIFLKPSEIREFYNQSLSGVIDINDLTGTQKNQILAFAVRERNTAISFINEILLVNPDATFEHLIKSNANYQNAELVINWLKKSNKNEKEIQNFNHLEVLEQLEKYAKIGLKYSKGKNWTVEEWAENNFDSIISIDMFFDDFLKSNRNLSIKEGLDILSLLKIGVKSNIKNPILENDIKVNKYFYQRIKDMEQMLKLSKYSESDNLDNESLIPQPINQPKSLKYKADEYALAYVFDLWAQGKQVPSNRIEGGYNAKELKRIGANYYKFKKPDTFYRAVRKVLTYDLNKTQYLESISKDWYNAVKKLSKNWVITEQYLRDKNLTGE